MTLTESFLASVPPLHLSVALEIPSQLAPRTYTVNWTPRVSDDHLEIALVQTKPAFPHDKSFQAFQECLMGANPLRADQYRLRVRGMSLRLKQSEIFR